MSASEGEEGEGPAEPTYSFKPSLMGSPCHFALEADAMRWQVGRRSGRLRYDRVRTVRLSYRPVTMQSYRFVTEIWSSDSPKIQIVSSSWRSIMEQERLDAGYSAFVTELHRRIAAAGAPVRFTTGLPVITYWFGIVLFGAVLLGTAFLAVRGAQLSQWGAAAIIAAVLGTFAYQLGNYFWRNRPGRYSPDAIPKTALPRH